MIKLYLDMDGVLCNFEKAYHQLVSDNTDRKKFREAVITHKIFRELEFMPDTQELLNYVSTLKNIDVQILTSMGTHDPFQANAAKEQKLYWLEKNNIPYKPNFVHSKEEKANYATPTSILVDDSAGCIGPFERKGGHGILHTSAATTIPILSNTILQIAATKDLN